MKHLIRLVVICLVLLSTQAFAQQFTGLWYDASKSGEGVTIQQDGTTVFVLWYASSLQAT